MQKIYLKINKKPKSLKELLEYGFTKRFGSFGYFVHTYHDIECTKLQCNGLRRSFEDLLAIAKTYFPSTTETKLMKVLMTVLDGKLKFYRCDSIKKIVFHINGTWNISAENFLVYQNKSFVDGTYSPEELANVCEKIEKKKNGKQMSTL